MGELFSQVRPQILTVKQGKRGLGFRKHGRALLLGAASDAAHPAIPLNSNSSTGCLSYAPDDLWVQLSENVDWAMSHWEQCCIFHRISKVACGCSCLGMLTGRRRTL